MINDIPHDVYVVLLIIFSIGSVMAFVLKGMRKGLRWSMGLLLIEYVFLLFCSTVIFRKGSKIVGHDFCPFWSYKAILEGRDGLIGENIMNATVFVPVGLLIGTLISQKTQKGWLAAMVAGLLISVSIEALQFFLHRGFAEVDDVMHNTMGCLIGYGLFKLIRSFLLNLGVND